MSEPKYRTATAADVPWLVQLIESAYRGESSKAGWTTEAHLLDGQRTDEDDVRAVVETPDSRIIVVELAGEPVACCQLQHRGTHAYFGMFAVRPTAQGTGLGKKVIAEAERVARDELGLSVMEMTVLRQRADLIAWYERRGYVRTGEVKPFPYGDERFGKPRRDDLEFAVLSKDLVRRSVSA
ncbi:GNAT family N-acetyltransferase [Catenulispora pinisilvae]|uniref:GNAT family N-acetyltransferase n=1 Tax=Catenulispora pinisilvae TaxID=2705253 RepID=UPI00189198CC|nr:GNAT family N-acetyltransferase [Catenulispora pinisilvae]